MTTKVIARLSSALFFNLNFSIYRKGPTHMICIPEHSPKSINVTSALFNTLLGLVCCKYPPCDGSVVPHPIILQFFGSPRGNEFGVGKQANICGIFRVVRISVASLCKTSPGSA